MLDTTKAFASLKTIFKGNYSRVDDYINLSITTMCIQNGICGVFEEGVSQDFDSAIIALDSGDHIVINLFGDYIPLEKESNSVSEDDFDILSSYRLSYGTEFDLFFENGATSDQLKEDICNSFFVFGPKNLTKTPCFETTDIISIKAGENNFDASANGEFVVTVTYHSGENENFFTFSAKVGDRFNNPQNQVLSINDSSDGLLDNSQIFVEINTDLNSFLTSHSSTIKAGFESEGVAITEQMISGWNTETEGEREIVITHAGLKKSLSLVVYNPIALKPMKIQSPVVSEKYFEIGEDVEFTFHLVYNNSTSEELNQSSEGVEITGYDKTVAGAQHVYFTYQGVSCDFVTYVFDEDHNVCTGVSFDNSITITDGVISGKYTAKLLNGEEDERDITIDMLPGYNAQTSVSGKDYIIIATVDEFEYSGRIYVDIVNTNE